ncbi:hypothetical protein E2C01_016918 [Portunus trituberculatus]|uniref:Uncharacterized protein n=1 Tax=Portunus trituberculatus TaxID=210409 RepID=A0A5B7DQC1_PORTR|nr:hypothetical protein [Portunus trituberculatus]
MFASLTFDIRRSKLKEVNKCLQVRGDDPNEFWRRSSCLYLVHCSVAPTVQTPGAAHMQRELKGDRQYTLLLISATVDNTQ